MYNADIETNISQPGITRNKTKAEVLYDLTLACMSNGMDTNKIIGKVKSMYNELLNEGIIYEVN